MWFRSGSSRPAASRSSRDRCGPTVVTLDGTVSPLAWESFGPYTGDGDVGVRVLAVLLYELCPRAITGGNRGIDVGGGEAEVGVDVAVGA